MFCKFCGQELKDETIICPHCGSATGKTAQSMEKESKLNVFCLTGFILSIVSLFITLYGIPAVIGLVLSCIGRSQTKKDPSLKGGKLALAGLIISIVSIVWAILYYAVIVTFINAMLGAITY